jgi:hypothetical protein
MELTISVAKGVCTDDCVTEAMTFLSAVVVMKTDIRIRILIIFWHLFFLESCQILTYKLLLKYMDIM